MALLAPFVGIDDYRDASTRDLTRAVRNCNVGVVLRHGADVRLCRSTGRPYLDGEHKTTILVAVAHLLPISSSWRVGGF